MKQSIYQKVRCLNDKISIFVSALKILATCLSPVRSLTAVEKLLNNLFFFFFKKQKTKRKQVVEITYFLSEPSVHPHTAFRTEPTDLITYCMKLLIVVVIYVAI